MNRPNPHYTFYVSVIVILLFAACSKKATPKPTPTDPAPPTPTTISNGTYKIIKDQAGLGDTLITRSITECEANIRYTFVNGIYTYVNACNTPPTTTTGTYTYTPGTAALVVTVNGYALTTTVNSISDTGFVFTQQEGFGQSLRLQLSLISK